jgi:hypothetical protein
MCKIDQKIYFKQSLLLCFLFILSFVFYDKSAEGSENCFSCYLISLSLPADINIDQNRLEKSFPGDFDCSYDIYVYRQFLYPDSSDSTQIPYSKRKKSKGIITKTPEFKILLPPTDFFTYSSRIYKNFHPIVLYFSSNFVGSYHNIRPPPFLSDRR